MPAESPTGERLLAYLLGELPPEELADIDRQLLDSDEFADALEDARNELLDAYARGTLAPARHERIGRALGLAPLDHGFQVAFSNALHRTLQGQPRAPRAGYLETARPIDRRGRSRPRYWAVPLAACLALAAGLWIARDTLMRQAGRPAIGSGPQPAFVLLLSPEVLRGPTAIQTVSVPQRLASLDVQLVVPDPSFRYTVRIEDPPERTTYSGLIPRTVSGVSFVELSIPRTRLKSRTYDFLLLREGPGAGQPLERYVVRLAVS
ncbi:MAG TPA: hypothetical protein VMD49_02935 [Steroidobacteraceae bacterium]|nr:hypothetical protein [Steroidobacteraceae bacterium]